MLASYEERYEKVLDLAEAIGRRRDEIVAQAVRDIRFTVRDTANEVDIAVDRLRMYGDARAFLEDRRPLGGDGSSVSLMLSYNGSAWLNTAITSIGSGKGFMEQSLADPETSAVVVFGFDENVLPYEEAFRRTGKKLVFEGPGQGAFVVKAVGGTAIPAGSGRRRTAPSGSSRGRSS